MSHPVLLATCREWSELHPDDQPLIDGLRARGIPARAAVWDDPSVPWSEARAVVLRSTWDYPGQRDVFLSWLEALPVPVFNPAPVVRWNTDKRYLHALAERGVPVTPTVYLAPGEEPDARLDALGAAELVVKPTVSAGSQDTLRLRADDVEGLAGHLARIHQRGKTAMVQPYLSAVEEEGETALLFFDGVFSHAIRKGPLLREVGRLATDGLYAEETIDARRPSDAEIVLGRQVLDALPFEPLLYARIDLIPGPDRNPRVLEVELSEPSLFFEHGPGSRARFLDAVMRRLV